MLAPLRRMRSAPLPALLIALILGSACGDSLAPDVTINRVTLTPVTSTIGVGSTQQLIAIARNRRSDPLPDIPFTFESLQPTVATVSSTGLVTAVGAGTATMRATTGTFSATSTIIVTLAQCTNATTTTTITSTQTINGALTANDCIFTGLGHADGYRFVATAPTTVLFTLTGATIRPKLSLTGTTAGDLISDLWSNTLGDTVRLVASVSAGTYTLWVVSNSDDLGPYVLKSQNVVPCTAALAGTPIALDQTVIGALTDSSCLGTDGGEAMGWSLNLSADTDVRLDVGAAGFRPRVVIRNSSFGVYSGSIPVGTDSAVLVDRIPAGNYTVWVNAIDGAQGTFTMKRSTAVFTFCDVPIDTIGVPGSINGTLGLDDCVLEPGFASDPIFMEVLVPTSLRINLSSNDFDTVIAIADSTDIVIGADDDGGFGTNSLLTGTFPKGRYTLLPQGYDPNSSGAYTLSVSLTAGINEGNVRLTPKPKTRVRRSPVPADLSVPR